MQNLVEQIRDQADIVREQVEAENPSPEFLLRHAEAMLAFAYELHEASRCRPQVFAVAV